MDFPLNRLEQSTYLEQLYIYYQLQLTYQSKYVLNKSNTCKLVDNSKLELKMNRNQKSTFAFGGEKFASSHKNRDNKNAS